MIFIGRVCFADRASDDYAGSSVTNFNLQTSSLLGWAVGLRPSKDVFFTTANEPNNPYMRRLRPTHPTVPGVDLEMNALIATLSTGPVASESTIVPRGHTRPPGIPCFQQSLNHSAGLRAQSAMARLQRIGRC